MVSAEGSMHQLPRARRLGGNRFRDKRAPLVLARTLLLRGNSKPFVTSSLIKDIVGDIMALLKLPELSLSW